MSPQTPLGCDSSSDCPCFWWLWQFWGVLIGCFIECLSIEICQIFFPLSLGIRSLGEQNQSEVPFTTSYQRYLLSALLITGDTDLDHLAKVVFVRFIHCKITLPSLPPPPLLYQLFRNVIVAFVLFSFSHPFFSFSEFFFYMHCDNDIVGGSLSNFFCILFVPLPALSPPPPPFLAPLLDWRVFPLILYFPLC